MIKMETLKKWPSQKNGGWFPKVDANMFLNCLSLMGKGMALRSPLWRTPRTSRTHPNWILITKKCGSCKIGRPNKVNNGLVVLRVFSLVSPWGFTQIHWGTVNVPFNQCWESYPILLGEYDKNYRFIQKPMKPAFPSRLPSRLTMKKTCHIQHRPNRFPEGPHGHFWPVISSFFRRLHGISPGHRW